MAGKSGVKGAGVVPLIKEFYQKVSCRLPELDWEKGRCARPWEAENMQRRRTSNLEP